ncbi:hypothetical protein J6590_091560, partial [Homalodisca vitripennis]
VTEPPLTAGQARLQGRDNSAVTYPSSSPARRCLIGVKEQGASAAEQVFILETNGLKLKSEPPITAGKPGCFQ